MGHGCFSYRKPRTPPTICNRGGRLLGKHLHQRDGRRAVACSEDFLFVLSFDPLSVFLASPIRCTPSLHSPRVRLGGQNKERNHPLTPLGCRTRSIRPQETGKDCTHKSPGKHRGRDRKRRLGVGWKREILASRWVGKSEG